MTQQELISSFSEYHVFSKDDILKRISKFLESNVCIPKGENRHPYADVLHKWVEDMTLPLEWYNDTYDSKEHHGFIKQSDNLLRINKQYRIKPHEPVYEYQWLVLDHQTYIVSDSGRFMTLEETCDGMIAIEETKRERR